MTPEELRDDQALACLEAGATHCVELLAVAVKLTGDEQSGMDLFQQVLLNCHDAIQRNGFVGDRYEFYLRTVLKNQYRRDRARGRKTVSLDRWKDEDYAEMQEFEQARNWHFKTFAGISSPAESAAIDPAPALLHLANCVREKLTLSDRIILRLHADGYTYRDIAVMTGAGGYSGLQRRVEKLKSALRATFGALWADLEE